MKNKLFIVLLSMFMMIALTSCGTYYMVKDPTSEKVYYTEKVNESGAAIKFKDTITGSEVTIQNSEVKEISKEYFQENTTETKQDSKVTETEKEDYQENTTETKTE